MYQTGNAGNPYGNRGTGGSISLLQDFSDGGSGRVKHCGVLEFDFDPAMGEFVRLDVDKNSSVYRYFIEYPSN